jgi:hypothetical protein
MDPRTMEQLKSLGYLSGGVGREIEMNGQGADPKDRVNILELLEEAAGNDAVKLPVAKRVAMLRAAVAGDRRIHVRITSLVRRSNGRTNTARRWTSIARLSRST